MPGAVCADGEDGARRYRTVEIQACPHTITAASPLPDDLRQAIKAINTSQPAHQN